jgi:hypothetical protein
MGLAIVLAVVSMVGYLFGFLHGFNEGKCLSVNLAVKKIKPRS